MTSISANLHCYRKDREGNYRRDRSTLQNPAASGIVCFNMFKRTFSSKNCVFTGKHDQKCRRSSDSELYCNLSSFCSLEGTKSIKKESKYMISNTLRLSRQHCNLKGRNLPKRGNTTTDNPAFYIMAHKLGRVLKKRHLRCILVSEVVFIKEPPGDISVSTWQAMSLGRTFKATESC